MPMHLFFSFFGHFLSSGALHSGFSDLWGSPPALSSTLTLGVFFECLGIQFFNSLTCDLRDTMPRQRSLTLIPREAEDFPRGDNHSKHVPLSTYLASLQPIYYNSQIRIYTCQNCKSFACGEDINKKK